MKKDKIACPICKREFSRNGGLGTHFSAERYTDEMHKAYIVSMEIKQLEEEVKRKKEQLKEINEMNQKQPMTPKDQPQEAESWEKEFEKLWGGYPRTKEENAQGLDALIKSFIHTLLQSERSKVLKEIGKILNEVNWTEEPKSAKGRLQELLAEGR